MTDTFEIQVRTRKPRSQWASTGNQAARARDLTTEADTKFQAGRGSLDVRIIRVGGTRSVICYHGKDWFDTKHPAAEQSAPSSAA